MRETNSTNAKYNLAWDYYFRLINKLHKKIDWDAEEFDYIVAINRGGNIIGTLLSHKTRLPLVVMDKEEVPDVRGKILIVDDISDTGRTLMKVISNLQSGTSYRTATLHVQPHTHQVPNYFVATTRVWVVYPYERVHKTMKETRNEKIRSAKRKRRHKTRRTRN